MVDLIKRNNIRVIGDGDRVILFAHGFGCDQNVWRHVIKAFQSDYKCIVFDYVGAGGSDHSFYDTKKYSNLDGYAQDVLDICEEFQLQDAIFIGHSVSSMIGVRAAISNPYYFSKLIFVAPSPCYINEKDYVGGLERSDLMDLLAMMDSNYLGWSSMIAPMVMGTPDRPELGEELTGNFCATDPKIAREFAKVTFLSDSRADLQKLTVPSLTLQCSNDMLAPLSVGYYIEHHTADNTLVILDAVGHCPHLSAPQETNRAIRSFLDSALKTLTDYGDGAELQQAV